MKKFTPIAMRCTQQQFEAVRQKFNRVFGIAYFSDFPYLVNNNSNKENSISNVSERRKDKFNRTVHETWNEQIFLEACGIEPIYEITKETILKYQMKDEFPEVFRFEKGYYKHKNGEYSKWFCYINSNTEECYGHNLFGEWFSACSDDYLYYIKKNCERMTHEEVEQSLIKEAEKRGFKEGAYFIDSNKDEFLLSSDFGKKYYYEENKLYLYGWEIFRNGTWAEIIPRKQMTQEQIEKELGYKIEIV